MSLALLAAQYNFAQIKVIDLYTLARVQDALETIIAILNALLVLSQESFSNKKADWSLLSDGKTNYTICPVVG